MHTCTHAPCKQMVCRKPTTHTTTCPSLPFLPTPSPSDATSNPMGHAHTHIARIPQTQHAYAYRGALSSHGSRHAIQAPRQDKPLSFSCLLPCYDAVPSPSPPLSQGAAREATSVLTTHPLPAITPPPGYFLPFPAPALRLPSFPGHTGICQEIQGPL